MLTWRFKTIQNLKLATKKMALKMYETLQMFYSKDSITFFSNLKMTTKYFMEIKKNATI